MQEVSGSIPLGSTISSQKGPPTRAFFVACPVHRKCGSGMTGVGRWRAFKSSLWPQVMGRGPLAKRGVEGAEG